MWLVKYDPEVWPLCGKTFCIYRMFSDFSVLQDLIPEAIPGQKCHMNMGLILNSYRYVGI